MNKPDSQKTYWGNGVHKHGMDSTRPIKLKYNPDTLGGWFSEEGDTEPFAWELGLHRDGPNAVHVTFVSENFDEVVIWMQGVVACMAIIHEWSSMGMGTLEHAKMFGKILHTGESNV